MFRNISKVLMHPGRGALYVFLLIGAIILWYIYSDVEYVAANYQSHFFAYFDTFLSWCAIVLFPLLLVGIAYRSHAFGIREWGESTSGVLGFFGGVISVLITGATCCGITLVSVLGLTSVIGFLEIFPYHGVELKVIWISFLVYAVADLYRHLDVCHLKR